MDIHLFGATSLTGLAFQDLLKDNNKYKLILYSSNDKTYKHLNLLDKYTFNQINIINDSILVSFAPIWYLKNFINFLAENKPNQIKKIKKFIICSSSSSQTKKYSANLFDIKLAQKLNKSEEFICNCLRSFNNECYVIQPAMIYGSINHRKDSNLNQIFRLMRIFPILFMPSKSGLRQPIHIKQLASFVFFLIENRYSYEQNLQNNTEGYKKILVGGDSEISYLEMINLMQKKLDDNDNAKSCRIIKIPNRLFLFLLSPLILLSPKIFDSFQRIISNLSGFHKVSNLMNKAKDNFPLNPL